MKKILSLTLSLVAASLTFATDSRAPLPEIVNLPRIDTGDLRARFDSLLQTRDTSRIHSLVDSMAFQHAPEVRDSLRQTFEEHKRAADSLRAGKFDTARAAGFKAKMDSLRKDWTAKRDSQIAKVKDTAVQAKLRDRVQKIEAKKAEVRTKIQAKKAELKATKPE